MSLNKRQRAWLDALMNASQDRESIRANRGSKPGILVNQDPLALSYQRAEFRFQRALFALTGDKRGLEHDQHTAHLAGLEQDRQKKFYREKETDGAK